MGAAFPLLDLSQSQVKPQTLVAYCVNWTRQPLAEPLISASAIYELYGMLDPSNALGLASSIAQLVEFVKAVISDGRQIAKLGSTRDNEHILTVVKDMSALSAKVIENYPKESHKSSSNDEALQDIAQASCEVSNELVQLLEGLQIQTPQNVKKRKRDVLNMSFKTMLERNDIQKLQKRLDRLQQELHLRLTFMMSLSHHRDMSRQKILETIMYPEIHDRQDTISEAYIKTYEWIFSEERSGFTTWTRVRNGLFWIAGKPGSGKSTLMKYVSGHRNTRNLLQSWAGDDKFVIAQHYFWIAGTAVQKSLAGLLRSILFQTLEQCPELAPLIVPQRFLQKGGAQHPWMMSELLESMRRIAELQGLPTKFLHLCRRFRRVRRRTFRDRPTPVRFSKVASNQSMCFQSSMERLCQRLSIALKGQSDHDAGPDL